MKTEFLLFLLLILSFGFSSIPSASAIDTTVRYNIEVVGSPYTYIWVDGEGPLKFSDQIYFDLDGLEPHTFVVSELICPSEESGEGFRDWRNGVRYVALECSWNAEAGTISTTYSGYWWYDPFTCSWIWIPQESYSFNPPPNSHTFEYTSEYRLVVEDKYQAPVSGPQWYKEGSLVDLPTPASKTIYLQEDIRVTFDGWEIDDSGSTATQITMNSPHKATAKYITEYLLLVTSIRGHARGSDWYKKDSIARISIEPEIPMEAPWGWLGGKYKFVGWADPTGTIVFRHPMEDIWMDRPRNLAAVWEADYGWAPILIPPIVLIPPILRYVYRRRRPGQPPQPPQPPLERPREPLTFLGPRKMERCFELSVFPSSPREITEGGPFKLASWTIKVKWLGKPVFPVELKLDEDNVSGSIRPPALQHLQDLQRQQMRWSFTGNPIKCPSGQKEAGLNVGFERLPEDIVGHQYPVGYYELPIVGTAVGDPTEPPQRVTVRLKVLPCSANWPVPAHLEPVPPQHLDRVGDSRITLGPLPAKLDPSYEPAPIIMKAGKDRFKKGIVIIKTTDPSVVSWIKFYGIIPIDHRLNFPRDRVVKWEWIDPEGNVVRITPDLPPYWIPTTPHRCQFWSFYNKVDELPRDEFANRPGIWKVKIWLRSDWGDALKVTQSFKVEE